MTIQEAAKQAREARRAVNRIVYGYEEAVELLLIALATGGHALLEGVPGVGKTTLAKTFATVSGLSFKRLQLTADLMPADITGHSFYNQASGKFEIREGPVFTNVLLADEINRAPPRTQSALLEVMEERQVTIDGVTRPAPDPFLVLATKNPIDIEGVYALPEAQLDRFMLFIDMGYPSPEAELAMLVGKLRAGTPAMPSIDLARTLRSALGEVRAHNDILGYVLSIARATRERPDIIELGAGPRASEHLLTAARGSALLEGRAFVIPDDVQRVAPHVLAHRLLLTADAEIGGLQRRDVVAEILAATPAPLEEAQKP